MKKVEATKVIIHVDIMREVDEVNSVVGILKNQPLGYMVFDITNANNPNNITTPSIATTVLKKLLLLK
ncbi:MAG: hypothetical protein U5K71_11215 [Gracilimonas sp.]|nr:hypothetical protein [Gracilimonas sp.]